MASSTAVLISCSLVGHSSLVSHGLVPYSLILCGLLPCGIKVSFFVDYEGQLLLLLLLTAVNRPVESPHVGHRK